jgi:hypothetical protein
MITMAIGGAAAMITAGCTWKRQMAMITDLVPSLASFLSIAAAAGTLG